MIKVNKTTGNNKRKIKILEVGCEEHFRNGTERNRQGIPPNPRGTEWNMRNLTGSTSTG
jgi:hypothetical protein